MKKIFLLSGALLITSSIVMADDTIETCANGMGTVIVGTVSGYKYCRANKGMNWWNAYAWCDAIGKKLFTLEDCQCSDTISNCAGLGSVNARDHLCPELMNAGNEWYVWTGTVIGKNDAYLITPSSGKIGSAGYTNLSHPPLCK